MSRIDVSSQKLLRAAEKIFSEKSYENVKMVDIAQAAGVGTSTIYRHFKDKATVFCAVFRQFHDDMCENLRGIIADTADFETKIRRMVSVLQESHRRRVGMYDRLCELFAMGRPGDIHQYRECYETRFSELNLLIAELMRQGQEAGQLRKSLEPQAMSFALLDLMMSWTQRQERMPGTPVNLESAFEIFFHGVKAR